MVRKARVLGDALVVLAGQEARSKGAPDGGSVLILLVQRFILALESLTVEGIVLRLLSNRGDEVVLLGDVVGFLDLLSRPLGSTPLSNVSQPICSPGVGSELT